MNQAPCILWAPSELAEQDCACAPDVPRIVVSMSAPTETDCACPTSGPEVAAAPPSTLWTLPPSLYRAPLPGGYELAFNPLAPSGVAVLNGPAARLLDSYTTPAPLADPPAQQLAALGLLDSIHPTPHAIRNTFYALRFTLWLHLTTRCNFRCAYCYAPRGQEDMSPEVGRAAVEGAIRSAMATGAGALKIKYGGGEPTLNLRTLRAAHEHARRRAAEAGLELQEVLLTNGSTLTPALLRWLRDEHIRLSISIDGMDSAHNQQRPSADGHPTSASVAAAVDMALALGLRPHLSVTITARNVDGLADIVAFALERGLPFNLNFVRPLPGQPDFLPDPERLIAGLQSALAIRNLQSAICNLQSAICNLQFAGSLRPERAPSLPLRGRPHLHGCGPPGAGSPMPYGTGADGGHRVGPGPDGEGPLRGGWFPQSTGGGEGELPGMPLAVRLCGRVPPHRPPNSRTGGPPIPLLRRLPGYSAGTGPPGGAASALAECRQLPREPAIVVQAMPRPGMEKGETATLLLPLLLLP